METVKDRRDEILEVATLLHEVKREIIEAVAELNGPIAALISAADKLAPDVATEMLEQPTTRRVKYEKIGTSARDVSDVVNQRKCGFCNEVGHDKRNCVKFAREKQKSKKKVH